MGSLLTSGASGPPSTIVTLQLLVTSVGITLGRDAAFLGLEARLPNGFRPISEEGQRDGALDATPEDRSTLYHTLQGMFRILFYMRALY